MRVQCLVLRQGKEGLEVLLGLQAGDMWNVPEREVGIREKPETAAIQVLSAAGLCAQVEDLRLAASVTVFSASSVEGRNDHRTQVFLAGKWEGEPRSCEEVREWKWFSCHKLPDELCPVAREFWPRLFRGDRLEVRATLGAEGNITSWYVHPL